MSEANVVLRTRDLTKRFGKETAVDAATFEAPEGCVFALIGRNGAGKTTTIRMLLGLEPITDGSADVLGLNSAKQGVEIRRRVGYVPEQHHIYKWMKVSEVVWFCSAFYPTWNHALCDDLLGRFDLDPRKKVKALSRGMVAKLALTLALAHEPKVLVLDEPTSGLDAIVRREFLESIVSVIAEFGRTVLISSHLLSDVERVADRVALMRAGRIELVEDLTDLKGRVRSVRVTFDGAAPEVGELPGVLGMEKDGREWLITFQDFSPATLVELGVRFPKARFEEQSLGLEDIFIALERGSEAVEPERATA